jgi:hypothetical protein
MQRRQFLKTALALSAVIATTIPEVQAVESKREGERVWGEYTIIPLRWIETKDGVTKIKVGGDQCHFNTLEELDLWMGQNSWNFLDITIAIGGKYGNDFTLNQLFEKYDPIGKNCRITVEVYSDVA